MPSKAVTEQGKTYIDVPGIGRYEINTKATDQGDPNEDMLIANAKNIGRHLANPEILAGLAGILAPETGGASLLVGPAVGAATSAARDLYGGERDPYTIAGHALVHGGVNAIPSAVGKLAEGGTSLLERAGPALGKAISSKAPYYGGALGGYFGHGGTGAAVGATAATIGQTLANILNEGKATATQLSSKIAKGTGGLSAQGVAYVKNQDIINKLRVLLGLGSLAPAVPREGAQP